MCGNAAEDIRPDVVCLGSLMDVIVAGILLEQVSVGIDKMARYVDELHAALLAHGSEAVVQSTQVGVVELCHLAALVHVHRADDEYPAVGIVLHYLVADGVEVVDRALDAVDGDVVEAEADEYLLGAHHLYRLPNGVLLALIDGMQAGGGDGLQRVTRAVAALAEEMGLPEEILPAFDGEPRVIIILPAEGDGIADEHRVGEPCLCLVESLAVKVRGHGVEPEHLTCGQLGDLRGSGSEQRILSGLLSGLLRSGSGLCDLGRLCADVYNGAVVSILYSRCSSIPCNTSTKHPLTHRS